jgi:hypothetical protein
LTGATTRPTGCCVLERKGWIVKRVFSAASYSRILLDLLRLTLQNGHMGWYSVKLALHLGQYQAITGIHTGIAMLM